MVEKDTINKIGQPKPRQRFRNPSGLHPQIRDETQVDFETVVSSSISKNCVQRDSLPSMTMLVIMMLMAVVILIIYYNSDTNNDNIKITVILTIT